MAALSLAFLCQDEDGRGMQLLRLAREAAPDNGIIDAFRHSQDGF